MTIAAEDVSRSQDDLRKALDSVNDYNKTLLTLATGTVALSATFLSQSLYRGVALGFLIAAWIVLGVSIFFGLLGLGSYVTQYSTSKIAPRHSSAELYSLVQLLTLLAGLGLLGTFAVRNAEHKVPVVKPKPPFTSTGLVTGKVTTCDHSPSTMGVVTVYKGSTLLASESVPGIGIYGFLLSPGDYSLVQMRAGYVRNTHTITISAGKVLSMNLQGECTMPGPFPTTG